MIDSGVLLEAVLRQSLYSEKPTGDDVLSRRCDVSITEQLRNEIREYDFHGTESLSDIVEFISVDYVGEALGKMAPFVPDLTALAQLEHTLRFTRNVEPYADSYPMLLISDGSKTHVRNFNYLNSYRYAEDVNGSPCKVSTFTGPGILSWDDVMELEQLINQSHVTEYDIQVWMERHPQLLLGTDYDCLHSQVSLLDDSGDELIPDFFAQRFDTGLADIIELKKPSARIIAGKKRRRGFSAAMTQALNQVREYRNYFDDAANRRAFHADFGFDAFRPTICVVIGRSSDFVNSVERIEIEDEYKNLKLMTYDDIVRRAKRMAIVT